MKDGETKKQKKWTYRQRNKENKPVWDKNEIKIQAFWS